MAKVFELKRRRPVIVFLPEAKSEVVVSALITNRFQVSEVWSVPELFDAIRSRRCAAVVTLDTSIALVLAIGSIQAMDANVYFGMSNERSTFDEARFLRRIIVLVDADGKHETGVCDVTPKIVLGRASDRPLGRLLKAVKSMVFGCPQPGDLK